MKALPNLNKRDYVPKPERWMLKESRRREKVSRYLGLAFEQSMIMFNKHYFKKVTGLYQATTEAALQMYHMMNKYRHFGANEWEVIFIYCMNLSVYAKDAAKLTEHERHDVFKWAYETLKDKKGDEDD